MEHAATVKPPAVPPALRLEDQRLGYALAQVRKVIGSAGIPDAGFEARQLVMAAAGVTREALLTDPDRTLTNDERLALETMVRRRLSREPLQYVIGQVEFYGRSFKVDSRVLIPRPETELLIEQALAFAGEHNFPAPRVLDIGTGSGVIAVTLATELPASTVVATDISLEALAVAKENAQLLAVAGRIEFVHCSLAAGVSGTFEIVVCNPPYVLTDFLSGPDIQPELGFEPRTALDGGRDGMAVYRPLLGGLDSIIAPGGAAFIEIDPPVTEQCLAEAKSRLPEASVSVLTDLAGLERCLLIELPH